MMRRVREMQNSSLPPDETRRRGQLVLHALPILLIPAFTAAVAFWLIRLTAQGAPSPDRLPGPPNGVVPIIVMAVFMTALVVLVRVGRPTISALLLIGAWTLFTTLATLRGGVTGIGPAFLIIPICAAGLLIDGLASMSLAALSTVLVVSLGWLEAQGIYVATGQFGIMVGFPVPLQQVPLIVAAFWTGLFWTVSLLTSLLAGGLQRALEQTRHQAQELLELSNHLETRVAAQTAELGRRAERAEALYAVSQALTSTLDLGQILDLIAEDAAHLLAFDSARLLLEQPDGNFALLGCYPHGGDNCEGRYSVGENGPSPALAPLLREMVESRVPTVVGLPEEPGTDDGGPRAALMLPMHYGDRVAGVLMLTDASGRADRAGDDLILGQGLADQAAVAIANAHLLQQEREAATLEERTRLARDIHDTIAQGLTGVVVQLGATQRALALAPEEAREHLALAMQMARETLGEARRSVWNLRAAALERGDLAGALQALALRPLGAHVNVTFQQIGEFWPLAPDVESTLLRVCQEALANVASHAQASEATVTLDYELTGVHLRVADNGIGLDGDLLDGASRPTGLQGGFGLLGMRERVGALGGTLEVSSDGGTQILVTIPRHLAGPRTAAARPSPSSLAENPGGQV
jgi:signal transduction histidine kinase